MNNQINPRPNSNFNAQSQYNQRGGRSNGQGRRTNRQFYCWTHGAGHSGWNCKNPADDHRPEATFSNRMGGNNYGCFTFRPQRRFNNTARPRFNNNNNISEANDKREENNQN